MSEDLVHVDYDDDDLVGLEDIDESTLSTPRLKIDNKAKAFTEEQTGVEVEEFEGIILGMVRQRVMWDPDIDSDLKKPLCRSRDGKTGMPLPDHFPMDASGFEGELEEGDTLDCADCKLKEWGTNPKDQKTPWCSEQFVLPIIADLEGNGDGVPVILTAQRTSMNPVRNYLGSFKQGRKPAFSITTRFSLEHLKRGSTEYSVPILRRGTATDPDTHPQFRELFLGIRDYLTSARVDTDAAGEELEDDLA